MKESSPSTSWAPHRQSSGRRRSSNPSIIKVNVSTHLSSHPVDATSISVDHIAQEIPNRSSSLMTHLDFVYMSKNILDILFVSDHARSRQSSVLVYPPKHHRHIAKQIKNWFNCLGGSDKKREMDSACEYQIKIQHDNEIIWDGQGWTHPIENRKSPPDSSSSPTLAMPPRICYGVTLQSIEDMQIRADTVEKVSAGREKLRLGFKHVVREEFTERSNISQPNDDKWMMVPPTVGVVSHGLGADKIFWTIEEQPRIVGSDQFYYLNIHAAKCQK